MWGGAEFTEGKGIEHNEANCAVGYCSVMLAPVVTEPVFWPSRCLSVSLCSCLACGLLPQDFLLCAVTLMSVIQTLGPSLLPASHEHGLGLWRLLCGGQKLAALKIILAVRMENAELNEAAGCADMLPAPSSGLPGWVSQQQPVGK